MDIDSDEFEEEVDQVLQPSHLLAVVSPEANQARIINVMRLFQQMSCEFYHPAESGFHLLPLSEKAANNGVYLRPLTMFQLQGDISLPERMQLQCTSINYPGSKQFDLLVKESWVNGKICLYSIITLSNADLMIPEPGQDEAGVSSAQRRAGKPYYKMRERERIAAKALVGLPEIEHRVIFDVRRAGKSRQQALRGIIDALQKLQLTQAWLPQFQLLCRTHDDLDVLSEVYDPNDPAIIHHLGNQLFTYFLSRPISVVPFEQRFETLLDFVSTWRCVKPRASGYFIHNRAQNVLNFALTLRDEIFNNLHAITNEEGQNMMLLGQALPDDLFGEYFSAVPNQQMAQLYNKVIAFIDQLQANLLRLDAWKLKAGDFTDKNAEINSLYTEIRNHFNTEGVLHAYPIVKNQPISSDDYQLYFRQAPRPIRLAAQAYNRAILERGTLDTQMSQLMTPPEHDGNAMGMQQ